MEGIRNETSQANKIFIEIIIISLDSWSWIGEHNP